MLRESFAARVSATCRGRPQLTSDVARAILLHRAVAPNAHGSAALEGNQTSLDRVEGLLVRVLERRILKLIRDALRAEGGQGSC